MSQSSYQTLTSAPIPLKAPQLRRAISGTRSATISLAPIITYNTIATSEPELQQESQNNKDKQTTYTIKRTYIAPNGLTRTKTIEYHGDEAKKLINEMKERELVETKNVDSELIKNVEEQFDNIKNPDAWLEHGFDSIDSHNNQKNIVYLNDNNNNDANEFNRNDRNIYHYVHHHQQDQQQNHHYTQPIKVIHKFKPQKGCISSKNHSATSEKFLFIKDALDEHNRYRYIHRVPYLKLNRELCNLAQEWAEKIAITGKFEHSNHKYLNQSLGENIAMRYTSTGDELDGKQMTEQWYEEAASYNYNLDFQSGKGHFAQIVWKNTQQVGFGRAKSKDGKWYAVANYYPAGNYIGHFRENVLPPLSSN